MKRVDQVTWFLQEAISHALTVLSWFEAYTSEEIPPENVWDDAEAVEDHFRRIRERKDAERDGYDMSSEEPQMMGNDLASVFKR